MVDVEQLVAERLGQWTGGRSVTLKCTEVDAKIPERQDFCATILDNTLPYHSLKELQVRLKLTSNLYESPIPGFDTLQVTPNFITAFLRLLSFGVIFRK